MRKSKKILKEIILELEKTPMVNAACSRVGVSRNSYYRWIKEDTDFKFKTQEAQKRGIEYLNDIAESVLFKKIKEEEFRAVKFWLQNNNKRYHTKERLKDEKPDFGPVQATINLPCRHIKCARVPGDEIIDPEIGAASILPQFQKNKKKKNSS